MSGTLKINANTSTAIIIAVERHPRAACGR
jgi:hypothetical protein